LDKTVRPPVAGVDVLSLRDPGCVDDRPVGAAFHRGHREGSRVVLTTDELRALIADRESDRVERKSSAADRSAIRRNLCAFANDLPGRGQPGVIFVGVRDDGRCADLRIDDRLLRLLASMKDDGNILPPPSIVVEKRRLRGCEVAVLVVQPSTVPPLRYKGRVWIKVGPTVREATAEEEQRLAERRRSLDVPFDLRPGAAGGLDQLDVEYFRTHYLPQAVAPAVLERNRRPLDQQLDSLRLLAGGRPNWGALLAFGHDPQRWVPGSWVQFVRLDGTSITDRILSQRALTGKVDDVLRRLDELLGLNVSIRTTVAGVPKEVRRPDYPHTALQQLAWNAVMHRCYATTNAPIRVYWFEDRVEISSPGGLFGRVTPENFGAGATDYRNPLLAEIMHNLGYGQRFGLGIPLAREALEENGNPPAEFRFEPSEVRVTARPAE